MPRPLMLRATVDPVVAARGKQGYARLAANVERALSARGAEIGHRDSSRAINSSFRVLYSAIAHHLGFGSPTGTSAEGDWRMLKEDLGFMVAAFLKDQGNQARAYLSATPT